MKIAFTIFLLFFLVSCGSERESDDLFGGGDTSQSPVPDISSPTMRDYFVNHSPPADMNDYNQYSIYYNGNGSQSSPVFTHNGYDHDGDHWGRMIYHSDQNQFSIQRKVTDGICSPECPFTWGNGGTDKYKGNNPNFFPTSSLPPLKFSELTRISATMKLELLTGNLRYGFAGCALLIGFGSGSHLDQNLMETSLNIANRGSKRDYLHFSYQIENGGNDLFRIESPINSESNSKFGTDARFDTDFSLTGNHPLLAHGEYVEFIINIVFNHEQEQADISMVVTDSNTGVPLGSSESIEWNYITTAGYKIGNEDRAGIAVNTEASDLALSKTELMNADVHLGMNSNGVVKTCEFSELKINVLKEL